MRTFLNRSITLIAASVPRFVDIVDLLSSAPPLPWCCGGKVHYVALWTNQSTILLFFTVYIFWRCWALEWRTCSDPYLKLTCCAVCFKCTENWRITKSINLHYIIFLSVINQWKSSKHFFFSLIVQGTYVEVMCRALKTHLMANLSEQIVVISFPLYITFLH